MPLSALFLRNRRLVVLLLFHLVLFFLLGRRRLVHHRIKSGMLVGRVLDGPHRTVGLHHGVLALNHVAVPRFLLALDVPRVVVVHAVFERVLGRRLKNGRH